MRRHRLLTTAVVALSASVIVQHPVAPLQHSEPRQSSQQRLQHLRRIGPRRRYSSSLDVPSPFTWTRHQSTWWRCWHAWP